jgi:hypothetical protein
MGIYQPQSNMVADASAMAATLAAFERTIQLTVGNGILSGMQLTSSGMVMAGYALIGHVIKESGTTSLAAQLTGTGTFDVYVCAPAVSYLSSGIADSSTYPSSDGYDPAIYLVMSKGVKPTVSAVMIATVVVSASSIVSVTDQRTFLTTQSNISNAISRLCTKETTLYGNLSAPLPAPLLFVAPSAMTINGVMLAVATAPVGQAIIAKIQKNGSDVWTSANYPKIAAGSNLGTASNPDGVCTCASGDIITVDLTQVGIATPGKTLAVVLEYTLN